MQAAYESVCSRLHDFTPKLLGTDEKDGAALAFQCIDIATPQVLPPEGDIVNFDGNLLPDGTLREHVEVASHAANVCMYGTDDAGRSIMLLITDFRPYFYAQVPDEWSDDRIGDFVQDMIPIWAKEAPQQLSPQQHRRKWKQHQHSDNARKSRPPMKVLWERSPLRHLTYGYQPSPSDPRVPKSVTIIKVRFESALDMRVCAKQYERRPQTGCALFEVNVGMTQKFLDDTRLHGHGVEPMGWVGVRRCTELVSQQTLYNRARGISRGLSHCDVQIKARMSDVFGLPDVTLMAAHVVASVDIECFGSTDEFPRAEVAGDAVICIGTSVQRFGHPQTLVHVAHCLGCAKAPEGVSRHDTEPSLLVISCDTEQELLESWRDLLVVVAGADVVIGYNIWKFDFEYLYQRARLVAADRFFYLGKMINELTELKKNERSSSALGDSTLAHLLMTGRVAMDMYDWIKNRFKLKEYKLNSVGVHFLSESKVDLPYKTMNDYYRQSADDPTKLWEIARYCSQDCNLPLRLMVHLKALIDQGELARATMTMLSQVLMRGQQVRVFNQIVLEAHAMGYVVNDPPNLHGGAAEPDDTKYEGATVLAAKTGYYDEPIATLDFASLYPSIMIAHNLCYATYVLPADRHKLPAADVYVYTMTDGRTHAYAKTTPGILPRILTKLIGCRKATRSAMKVTHDPDEKAVLDSRQLALKVCCNSVYGFTGVRTHGMYPNLAIAETVTFMGRGMITKTKDIVEQRGFEVIYGDTDSVMVRFGVDSQDPQAISRVFQMGNELSEYITRAFPEGVLLEMEKVSQPYLLIAKKRYVALVYEAPDAKPKIDAKGIEIVRRDACGLTTTIMNSVIDGVIYRRDPALARRNLQAHLESIVRDDVAMGQYVMTKAMKSREAYANLNHPHLRVAELLAQRKAAVPRPGDRVPFVYVNTPNPDAKGFEKAEDPGYAAKHGIPIDRGYYIKHQIMTPVCTVLGAVGGAADDGDGALSPGRLCRTAIGEIDRQRRGVRSMQEFVVGSNDAGEKATDDDMFSSGVAVSTLRGFSGLGGAAKRPVLGTRRGPRPAKRRRPPAQRATHDCY